MRLRKLSHLSFAAIAIGGLAVAACGSDEGEAVTSDAAATVPATGPAAVPAASDPVATPVATTADTTVDTTVSTTGGTLRIGAIPDQDVEKLNRTYGLVSDYLATELGVEVEYVPVTEYSAAVGQFLTGDLDLVWFGGLTGVQARLQTPGAEVIAQRDIDPEFRSLFIANTSAGLAPITDVAGLSELAGTRFTFGSESSTSGRLMPQYFLDQAGVGPDDFDGEAGFSGSHDKTIDLVQAGTFEAGAVNKAVWDARVAAGEVDEATVQVLFTTPTYHDYHWIVNPSVAERFGAEFPAKIQAALLALDPADPADAEILDLFGAGSFIESDASNYTQIEEIGRTLGLING
jgi:phosphonate transport system substrate-binding protein